MDQSLRQKVAQARLVHTLDEALGPNMLGWRSSRRLYSGAVRRCKLRWIPRRVKIQHRLGSMFTRSKHFCSDNMDLQKAVCGFAQLNTRTRPCTRTHAHTHVFGTGLGLVRPVLVTMFGDLRHLGRHTRAHTCTCTRTRTHIRTHTRVSPVACVFRTPFDCAHES